MRDASAADQTDGLRVQFRPDIEWVQYVEQAKWVARDPLSNAFYYFSQLEHVAAKFFDGRLSTDEVLRRLRECFPGIAINRQWLASFVARLKNACLVLPAGHSAIEHLSRSRSMEHAGLLKQIAMSPMAFRVPVFDPSRFLNGLTGAAFLLFHPLVAAMGLIVATVSGFLVLNKFLASSDQFIHDVTRLDARLWLLILALYLLVKSLHELGHTLACIRWKAQCREIGLLFLFFTPCLYCDTTDSWKLQSKWQRAAIASAGLYVELLLASLAAIFWLNANDGTERILAASVMLTCSMGTIFVNGNPCFKYDGYYILSDIWGVPNLSQQSSNALWQIFTAMLGGRAVEKSDFDKSVWSLAAYALISSVYRFVVMLLLLWFVWNLLVPRGLGFVAVLIVSTTILGFMMMTMRFLNSLFMEFFTRTPILLTRFLLLFVFVGMLAAFTFAIPVPNYVRSRGVVDFHDKIPLFAPQNATIYFATTPDSALQAGDLIFEFDCPEKQLERIELANQIALMSQRYELLKKSSVNDASAAFEMPTLLEILNELKSKQSVLQPELDSLRMYAPSEGFFLPSEKMAEPSLTPPWHTGLLQHLSHANNRGCAVERGMLLGWFTTKKKVSFQTLVSEADIKSLRMGMPVECMLDACTSEIDTGRISRISPDPIQEITTDIFCESWVVTERNEKGKLVPISPHYQVSVEADTDVSLKIKQANATIQFKIASWTLAEHLTRYFRKTFRPIR